MLAHKGRLALDETVVQLFEILELADERPDEAPDTTQLDRLVVCIADGVFVPRHYLLKSSLWRVGCVFGPA